MRTIVYIDGFNLYYRALKFTAHKWLNVLDLSRAVMPAPHQIDVVNYYTARVSGRVDPTAPSRQNAYLRALSTVPEIKIHYGNFMVNKVWAGLVTPPDFRPVSTTPAAPEPKVAFVWKTEEKGSDVNLASHLLRDAYQNNFEAAAVLTNDTDLIEPIRIITQEIGLPVTLLSPVNQPSTGLVAAASGGVRHIQPYIGPCVFPNLVIDGKGRQIHKPAAW